MIIEFAAMHRLKSVREGEGEDIERVILGRLGQSSIYEYSETEFAVSFMTDGRKAPRTELWNKFHAACLSVGMTPRQIGDAEGSFSFNPSDKEQAKVAIRGIKAKVNGNSVLNSVPDSLSVVSRLTATAKKALRNALFRARNDDKAPRRATSHSEHPNDSAQSTTSDR